MAEAVGLERMTTEFAEAINLFHRRFLAEIQDMEKRSLTSVEIHFEDELDGLEELARREFGDEYIVELMKAICTFLKAEGKQSIIQPSMFMDYGFLESFKIDQRFEHLSRGMTPLTVYLLNLGSRPRCVVQELYERPVFRRLILNGEFELYQYWEISRPYYGNDPSEDIGVSQFTRGVFKEKNS